MWLAQSAKVTNAQNMKIDKFLYVLFLLEKFDFHVRYYLKYVLIENPSETFALLLGFKHLQILELCWLTLRSFLASCWGFFGEQE